MSYRQMLAARRGARPTVGVSGGGARVDGGHARITGFSGAGTNTNMVQIFHGGPNGAIESQANGVTNPTISGLAWAGGGPAIVSTARSLHRSRSFLHRYGYNVPTGGTYTPGSYYQYGARTDPGVGWLRALTINDYFQTGFTNGQIKEQRFAAKLTDINGNNSDGLTDDSAPDILMNCFHGGIGSSAQWWDNTAAGANAGSASRFEEELPNIDFGVSPSWNPGGWARHVYDFTPGTQETADGILRWHFANSTDTSIVIGTNQSATRRFRRTGDALYRYWLMQYYMGNAAAQVDGAQVNWDPDYYGIFNTANTNFPKFLLCGNASTFSACTKFSHGLVFDAWADGQIDFYENKGQHASLAGTYIYIMTAMHTALNSSGLTPASIP